LKSCFRDDEFSRQGKTRQQTTEDRGQSKAIALAMTHDQGESEITDKETILFIVGPTAVGKTEFAIHLARRLGTEIVSADSMQVYQYMNIGTGKPTPQEREQAHHHLIDFVHPTEHYSVGRYHEEADDVINNLHKAGKIPMVVGGTGLYIRAITHGIFDGPEADHDLRNRLKEKALEVGLNSLYEKLKALDPESAKKIHPNDERRIIRALEVLEMTGQPISVLQKEQRRLREQRFRYVMFGLTTSRNRLYNRIEKRVDRMIENGLVQEVRTLLKMGVKEDAISMQGLGYKEMVPYLKKERSLERSVEVLKQETRHFAKRQFTWFKAEPRIHWFDIDDYNTPNKALEAFILCVDKKLAKKE
jgi:tRNA dimethylallyltransferase